MNYEIPDFLEYVVYGLHGDNGAILHIANQANLFGQTVSSLNEYQVPVVHEFIKRALARMIITQDFATLSPDDHKRFKTAMSKLFTNEDYCYWGDNNVIIIPIRFKQGELSFGAKVAVGVLNQIGKLFGV